MVYHSKLLYKLPKSIIDITPVVAPQIRPGLIDDLATKNI